MEDLLKKLDDPFYAHTHLKIGYEFVDKYGRKSFWSRKYVPIRNVDVEMLTMCLEQGAMTDDQILRMFSPGDEKGNKAVLKGVHMMRNMDFLREVKVKRFKPAIYLTTIQGLKFLGEVNGCCDSVEHLRAVDDLGFHFSEHNLMVTDARIAFARRIGLKDWTCKRLLRKKESRVVIPDGLLHRKKQSWVVKVESRVKPGRYYRNMFPRLCSIHERCDAILYVVVEEARLNCLKNQAINWKNIYFITLKDLLNEQSPVGLDSLEFTNARDEKYVLRKMDEKFMFDEMEPRNF